MKKVYDEEVKAGKHGTREERRASHILVAAAARTRRTIEEGRGSEGEG